MVEPHAGCLPPGLKHCSGGRKGHLGQGWKDCPGAPAPITVHGCMSWWTRAEPQDSWDHVLRKQSDTYHLFIPQLFTECLQHVQRWARHLGQGQPCPHGAGLPAVTEPDGGLPTLRPSGGEQRVQSELKTDSCHTKSKLLARPWRTSAPLPLPFLFLTRVAHRRFRVLTHCSLKCPFCQNSTPPSRLHSNAKSTRKASQALLGKISCCFFGVSSVVPITALGRYYMSLCTHVSSLLPAFPESGE